MTHIYSMVKRFVGYQSRNIWRILRRRVHILWWWLKSGQWAEQTAGHTALIGVPQELSIELLVPGQGQTLALSNLVKCFIQNVDIGVGHTANTVVAKLLDTDRTVAIPH